MSVEENKAIVRQFNEGITAYFQTGDATRLADLMDPNVVVSVPGMPPNREGMLAVLPAFRSALSQFQMSTVDMLAEGDLVACRLTWTAVHSGDLMGIPATGKTVTVTETHVDRIVNGKIVEHGGHWDRLGLLQQIGAIPA